jgi:hypothetical protein
MNKYLLSALSLIALSQAASAATIHYTIQSKGEMPKKVDFYLYFEKHEHEDRLSIQSHGKGSVQAAGGAYDIIAFWPHGISDALVDCKDSAGENITSIDDNKGLELILTLEHEHEGWNIRCDERGG